MAINKTHAKNKDKFLDKNGIYECSATDIRAHLDTPLDWGTIEGNIDNQVDLLEELDGKIDTFRVQAFGITKFLWNAEGVPNGQVDGAIDDTGVFTLESNGVKYWETPYNKFGNTSFYIGDQYHTVTAVGSAFNSTFNLFSNTGEKTFDFWAKIGGGVQPGNYVCAQRETVDITNTWACIIQYYKNNPTSSYIDFSRSLGSVNKNYRVYFEEGFNPEEYHHYTFYRKEQTISIYIDGIQKYYLIDTDLTGTLNSGSRFRWGSSAGIVTSRRACKAWYDGVRITNGNILGLMPNESNMDTVPVPNVAPIVESTVPTSRIAEVNADGDILRSNIEISLDAIQVPGNVDIIGSITAEVLSDSIDEKTMTEVLESVDKAHTGALTGIVTPTAVIPEYIGQIYVDTSALVFYISYGLNAGDWQEMAKV